MRRSYVFGLNNWGQLGVGTRSEDPQLPQRLEFFDDKEIVGAALSQHATVVLTRDGGTATDSWAARRRASARRSSERWR